MKPIPRSMICGVGFLREAMSHALSVCQKPARACSQLASDRLRAYGECRDSEGTLCVPSLSAWLKGKEDGRVFLLSD